MKKAADKPIPLRGEQLDVEELIAAVPVVNDDLITLYHGDCLAVLRCLPDMSVDSIVTDPPAGIEFMGKEWDTFKTGRLATYKAPPQGTVQPKDGANADTFKRLGELPQFNQRANRRCKKCGLYAWSSNPCKCETPEWEIDTSARATFIAFMTAVMVECFRVLKPGGHALVWAIPRTSHWTATAIEDAGFEVRDVVTHHFGSGFPKSLDVSKAIDKSTVRDKETAELKFRGFMGDIYRVTAFIAKARDNAGKSNADIDAHMGFVGMAGHWTSSKSQPAVPQWNQWLKLKELLAFGDEMDVEVHRLNARKGSGPLGLDDTAYAAREITGQHEKAPAAQSWKANYGLAADLEAKDRRDEPATAAAADWRGWGTALKPASEHWILARRPLSETNIAANVLRHGTGAINIDACRIDSEQRPALVSDPLPADENRHAAYQDGLQGSRVVGTTTEGRWPANLVLSHSDACGDACAPDCPVAELDRQSGERPAGPSLSGAYPSAPGYSGGLGNTREFQGYGDTGGASRFFYTAKASPSERNAGLEGLDEKAPQEGRRATRKNVHPTVKSTDLMRWLCRLITPRRGVVLDPFMGSGSTGVAAKLEDFRFIGIEREEEYMEIAKRRLGWATAQPALFDLDDVKTHAA